MMEKQVEQAPANVPPPAQASPPERKVNRGWFRKGHDPRRNTEGRPTGSTKREEPPKRTELVATKTERLKRFLFDVKHLQEYIQPSGGDRLATRDLPDDFKIVDCVVYHNGLMQIVVRSEKFERVAAGAVIPMAEVRWGTKLAR